MRNTRETFIFIAFFVGVNQLAWILQAEAKPPVVFFPGYGLSVMQVTVEGQTAFPSCPGSGNYSLHYQSPSTQNGFDLTCMTQLLTLSYNNITRSFSNVPGVTPMLQDFGSAACAPFYEPFFTALRDDGWTDNVDLFGACYDWRMAPNVDAIAGSNFVANVTSLVTNAYLNNNNQKVYLIGHSNGPIMIQYLLDVWTQSFKDTYIAAFISFAGNWPGQGLVSALLFQGLSVPDSNFLPSAAATFQTWPSTYFSNAQPQTFGDIETTIATPTKNYTALTFTELATDAGLTLALQLSPLFTGLVKPTRFPNVTVLSFYGSGLDTVVGLKLRNLSIGDSAVVEGAFVLPGDTNQEYITNESNLIWSGMQCYSFEPFELPGVSHYQIPSNITQITRTLAMLNGPTPRNLCSSSAGALSSFFVSPTRMLLNYLL